MRIPPFYRKPTWQRFFAGVIIGALMCWVLFFYMFGVQQEKQVHTIWEQNELIKDLNKKIAIWEEDYQKLNNQNEKVLTIQEVQIHISNGKNYNIDKLSIAEAEDVIRDDLASLIAKDVKTIYNGRVLLKKSIENKFIEINKKQYRLEVVEIMFYTEMYIEVKLKRV